MSGATLASVDATRQKGDLARKPGSSGMAPKPLAVPLNALSAAGNMAIQRAAAGPGPAPAAAQMGAVALDSGGCSCGGSCDDCKKKSVQRKGAGAFDAIPAGFESSMQRSGPGRSLGPDTRSMMEPGLGEDLGDVRVHDDRDAAEAASQIRAHAFTTGRDIYFGAGRYQPDSQDGRQLLAHELTHVVQQRRGLAGSGLKSLNGTPQNDPLEREAEEAERRVAHDALHAADNGHQNQSSAEKAVQKKSASGTSCTSCAEERVPPLERLKPKPVQRKADTASKAPAAHVAAAPPANAVPSARVSAAPGDPYEKEAETIADQVAEGRPVPSGALSALLDSPIQRYGWSDFVSDVEGALNAVGDAANDVADAASNIASAVWDSATALASALGGAVSFSGGKLHISVPTLDVCQGGRVLQFTLPEIGKDFTLAEVVIPVSGFVNIYGALSVHVGLTPEISMQVGPCSLTGFTITIDPLAPSFSAAGGVDVTVALGLGAEARAGLHGEVGVMVIWPDPPIILEIPVVSLEGGLAGMVRGIAADHYLLSGYVGYSGGTFSAGYHRTDDIGLALDYGLAGYGSLEVLGFNLCTLYWPLFEDHKETVLSLGLDADLTVDGSGATVDVTSPPMEMDRISFADLGVGIQRNMFTDNCPLCDFLRDVGLMPSQIGGPWPFHPTPPWSGPLPDVYPRDPGIVSGALCRGACGPDCDTCTNIGDSCDGTTCEYVCEEMAGSHVIWKYPNFLDCPSAGGCRDHDACYDWCADKAFERGPLGVIFGPCHRMCDFECICDHSTPQCVNWIFGKGADETMYFSDEPEIIGGCSGPCPDAEETPAGGVVYKICLDRVDLFDKQEFSDGFFKSTGQILVLGPLVFEVLEIPLVVNVFAEGSLSAVLIAGIGPAFLDHACLEFDFSTGSYKGTADLHALANLGALLQVEGALTADLSLACLLSILKVTGGLRATGLGDLSLELVAKAVAVSCNLGDPTLDIDLTFNPCLELEFDLDAFVLVKLFGFELFGDTWNLIKKKWTGCWPTELDILAAGSAGGVFTAGAGAPGAAAVFVGSPAGAGAGAGPGAAGPAGGPTLGMSGATPLLGPHDLDAGNLLSTLFAEAKPLSEVPLFPAAPDADSGTANPCPVPASAPTGLSCADAIHMRWFKPLDIYPSPITLDGDSYNMTQTKAAPPPDSATDIGVAQPFLPSLGKCLELNPQPRVGNQGRFRSLLQRHQFDFTKLQADHVQDVFWDAPDRFDNLWPLDSFKNQSAGSRQNLFQEIEFAETPGAPKQVMTLKDFKATKWAPDPSHARRFFRVGEIAF
jgi:hypothetical protein